MREIYKLMLHKIFVSKILQNTKGKNCCQPALQPGKQDSEQVQNLWVFLMKQLPGEKLYFIKAKMSHQFCGLFSPDLG